MTQVVDPKSGAKAPALEMNYKAANGYSREMEHWVTGGGVLDSTTMVMRVRTLLRSTTALKST